jgi:hypothetical protein
MSDAFVRDFIDHFDDSRFPAAFLERFEALECLAQNEICETLLVKDRQTGVNAVAKCYDLTQFPGAAESEILQNLNHPGLPAFTGEYRSERMTCVVRAFAPGQSLDQVARNPRFTPPQVLAVALQLCDILHYLHAQNPPVIHRDIKPQNIILDENGRIQLIDFGTARKFSAGAQADTLSFGTQYYAPPEQYGFAQTDPRSDIYSLGVLLCWLLTGSADVRAAKNRVSDRRLAGIIARCTAFSPADRYKSVGQVKAALTRPTARRWAWAGLGAGLVLLAVLLAVGLPLARLPGVLFGTPGGSPTAANAAPRETPGAPPGETLGAVTFTEPLIEAAARLALRKGPADAITPEDLLTITNLYVFGGQAAGDDAAYKTIGEGFANNTGKVSRGSIRDLSDLRKFANLRTAALAYQNITDLTPLADLMYLESLDLRHNPLQDVSPLARLTSLQALIVFDTRVQDLTALRGCPRLAVVDAGSSLIQSTAAFDGLDALQVLVMRKAPLASLERIETHPLLEKLYLSETQLLDLAPLLTLPRLAEVEVSQNMRAAAAAVEAQAQFSITYK